MVLKSIKKVGTRRGRSIVVRDDIDKTTSGRQVRQGIGKLMKLQAKDYLDPDGAATRRWRLQHVREHVRVFVEEERDDTIREGAMSCVEINQCVGCTRRFFTKSFLGDDAAVLARSSGEEAASPRHRAGVASMAWRATRRSSTNAP